MLRFGKSLAACNLGHGPQLAIRSEYGQLVPRNLRDGAPVVQTANTLSCSRNFETKRGGSAYQLAALELAGHTFQW